MNSYDDIQIIWCVWKRKIVIRCYCESKSMWGCKTKSRGIKIDSIDKTKIKWCLRVFISDKNFSCISKICKFSYSSHDIHIWVPSPSSLNPHYFVKDPSQNRFFSLSGYLFLDSVVSQLSVNDENDQNSFAKLFRRLYTFLEHFLK